MRACCWWIGMLLGAAVLSGCGDPVVNVFPGEARGILEGAERLELVTLDPSYEDFDAKRPDTLHGYRILGRAEIADAAAREGLVRGLFEAVRAPEGGASGCGFNPRHALIATRGGKRVDVLICFQCGDLELFLGEKPTFGHVRRGTPEVFENAVRAAGLVTATRPG